MSETRGGGALPIVQYWHSDDVPGEVRELIETFRELNPERPHLLFDEAAAEEFIAESFGDRELKAFRCCAVPSMQADYFRYCAILTLGGMYTDVGFRCRRSLRELIEAGEAQLFKRPRGHLINGIFVFARPGHPLLRLTLDVATANIERRAAEQVWSVTGPGIFTGLHIHCQRGLPIKSLGPAGGHERLAEAFEGVEIAPLSSIADSIGLPERPLRYRQDATHWVKWQENKATIFR